MNFSLHETYIELLSKSKTTETSNQKWATKKCYELDRSLKPSKNPTLIYLLRIEMIFPNPPYDPHKSLLHRLEQLYSISLIELSISCVMMFFQFFLSSSIKVKIIGLGTCLFRQYVLFGKKSKQNQIFSKKFANGLISKSYLHIPLGGICRFSFELEIA